MVQINHDVNGNDVLKMSVADDIELNGDINSNSDVKLVSETGTVTLDKDINSQAHLLAIGQGDVHFEGEFNSESSSKLESKTGSVFIGKSGDQKNGNNDASLSIIAWKDVTFFHTDLNGNFDLHVTAKTGAVNFKGDINSNAKMYVIASGDIIIDGDINSNVSVELISTQGSVTITGHINSNPDVRLTAAADIKIGKEIDGDLSVVARCEGFLSIGGNINNHAYVEGRAIGGITVQGNISDNSTVKLSVVNGTIMVNGQLDNNSSLTFWPTGSLTLTGGGNATANQWVQEFASSLAPGKTGSWWNNWLWSYGFVSDGILKPKTYQELVALVKSLAMDREVRIKAAGGGWSFSDVALPQDNIDSVNNVSIFKRGRNGTANLRYILRGVNDKNNPMDVYPFQVAKSLEHSSNYDDVALQNNITSGIDLKSDEPRFKLIDTRNICSSLQCQLKNKVVIHRRPISVSHRYWVEAGITITDLNNLLDHNLPRLAIEATGGSPGATLAGTISTATHGGEFKKPLMIDRILAVHLIGPGGVEWWIEGSNKVIAKADLQAIFPNISDANFVSSALWSDPNITADDFLKAVVTSMGTMGIIYSVVLEVVPQFSIQQFTFKHADWDSMLSKASVAKSDLVARVAAANMTLLNFVKDGSLNGTGISAQDNQYVDLAINPLSKSCWIVNRRFIPGIIDDSKENDLMSGYLNSVTSKMTESADVDGVLHSPVVGRLLDFLSIPRDSLGEAFGAGNISNFLRGISNSSNLLSSLLALIQIKAMWNAANDPDPRRGHQFLSDILEGVLDALQNTYEEPKAAISGVSFKVGAIGWPSTGISGRGFEIALSPDIAFSFVNDMLGFIDQQASNNKVFLGYISIRLCPKTLTVMGMQQFGDNSVMVEVVAHRTQEANDIFDGLIGFIKGWPGFIKGQFPPFHWGLETETIDSSYLDTTPFAGKYNATMSRIDVFRYVKKLILNGNLPIFDNNFVARMGF